MNIADAYNEWSGQYDSNVNKTRDLEAKSLRTMLAGIPFNSCLELGCGTGKNTVWLLHHCDHLTAVDFAEEMLEKARQKIKSPNVHFIKADLQERWDFVKGKVDLVTFSLVLEHFENLVNLFMKSAGALEKGGYLYIGELHPFRQYMGSKAKYETVKGTEILECYTHHLSDFLDAARREGFRLDDLKEYSDEEGYAGIPRILALLFRKM